MNFSYVKDSPLIEDFSLNVTPGMRVAIVGPTGCGKTTLINLLMRFYDADRGSIRIDGTPITDISRHSLRESFGMVLQDTWIKHDTVRANIAFGKPEASEDEIIKAAKEAHSWEFIEKLPEGLDTVLNEDSLSQGQKQRILIARAVYKNPDYIFLDEATNSLDANNERMIVEHLDEFYKGKTVVIVAHRLSTVKNADQIVVLDKGKVVETGNHEALTAKRGAYYNLVKNQLELGN